LIQRLTDELDDIGWVENRPKMEGNNLVAIFAPRKEK
jgi:translation initiation factor IF-3